MSTKEAQLEDLLRSLFPFAGDLRTFLVRLEGGRDVLDYIPGPDTPVADQAHRAVAALVARGMLSSSFFNELVGVRSGRGADIACVARSWTDGAYAPPASRPAQREAAPALEGECLPTGSAQAPPFDVEVRDFVLDFDNSTGLRLKFDLSVTNRGSEVLRNLMIRIVGYGTDLGLSDDHDPEFRKNIANEGLEGPRRPFYAVPLEFDKSEKLKAAILPAGASVVARLKPTPRIALRRHELAWWAGCLRLDSKDLPEPVRLQLLVRAIDGELPREVWVHHVRSGKVAVAVHRFEDHGGWKGPINWFEPTVHGVVFKVLE